jgi:ribosome-associated protein
VEDALARLKIKPSHTEGYDRTEWILLDYFDFVVHVFSAETRAFFGLERLWGSAVSVELNAILETPVPVRRA